jgi:hypothetical protein
MSRTPTKRAIVNDASPSVPSPACGGGTGRGQAANSVRVAAPSPTLPRERGRERASRAAMQSVRPR